MKELKGSMVSWVWVIVLSVNVQATYLKFQNEEPSTRYRPGPRESLEATRSSESDRRDYRTEFLGLEVHEWREVRPVEEEEAEEKEDEEQQLTERRWQQQEDEEEKYTRENCTERSVENFPKDLFTLEQLGRGAVLLHTFFGFYCFILTALVCNDYLLPSLDCICADLKISTDVAGATFLATASCFPELFVNVIGTFLTESDLGVGTVVGGAVFNTFATPACGALSALYAIQLEWRILTRDCAIYVISVGTLVVIMWDGLIEWYEAVILLVLLAAYVALLFSEKRLKRCCGKVVDLRSVGSGGPSESAGSEIAKEKPTSQEDESMANGSYKPYFHNELILEYRRKSSSIGGGNGKQGTTNGRNGVAEESAEEVEESQPDTPFVWPKERGVFGKAWFLFVWPLKLVLFVTIPDSRFARCRRWYPLTFLMCIVWIAITSYLDSWMMTVLGDVLRIPDSIMGITFLSAGGNMPELVTIVILSRQGDGNMAMSNTLGANTLDILLCLGLPWTVKILLTGKNVEIVSGALSYSVLSIAVCVVILYTVIALCGFKLDKKVGGICLLLYTVFLVFAILIETNVFFFVNLPMCEPR